MRKIVVVALSVVPLGVAFGAEALPAGGAIQLSWETLVTIYGPMAIWLAWFIKRDSQRERDEKAQHKESLDIIRNNTEALVQVRTALELVRADNDKHRTAIYRMVEEMRTVGNKLERLCDDAGFKTRIMKKNE